MTRWLPMFFALVTIGQSSAQHASPKIPGWGRFVDPSAAAVLKVDGQKVVITSGKNEMTVKDTVGKLPRIVRDVSGDFDVRVRVVGGFTKEYQAGVLLAFAEPSEYLRIDTGLGRYRAVCVSTGIVTRGTLMTGRHHPTTNSSMWLRIQRIAGELKSYYSYDGKQWIFSSSSKNIALKDGGGVSFTQPLKVMLLVFNRASKPLTVNFEHFEIQEAGHRVSKCFPRGQNR